MKILMAIKRLEDMAGGAERVFLQVAEGLQTQYGHELVLVTFDRKKAESFYTVPEGITWIRLGIGDSSKRAGYLETLKRLFLLRAVVKKISPDLLIPFQHSMFVPMVLAMTGIKIPVIASEHIVPDHYKSRPLEFALLILTGLRCQKITVLSDAIIKMYPKILWSRMVAISNPVVISNQVADVVGVLEKRKTLLSVGRLDPQKDQKTLIDAFALIADKFPDWDLKIIGEGTLRSTLSRQVEDLGLSERILLSGLTKNIMHDYQSSQAFVLASTYESFGLATAEAMSVGLPVIGFADCPGTNEIIKDQKNGLLVSVGRKDGRAKSLARAMTSIMSNADLRQSLGKQGRKDMLVFSPSTIVSQWQDLIKSVI
ncbi:MAG TPA: glycosyltransferase family 4 protein [Alphaproteobacteria bacterium]|nr:glycosyltransferase family 4 protein [Alphaproteobacteria bacterium]